MSKGRSTYEVWRRAFWEAGTARAKALWWAQAWHVSGTRKRQAQVSEGVKVEMKGKWRRDGWADGRMGAKVDPGLVKCSELAPRGKDLPVGHNSDPFLEASSGPLRFLVPTATPHPSSSWQISSC